MNEFASLRLCKNVKRASMHACKYIFGINIIRKVWTHKDKLLALSSLLWVSQQLQGAALAPGLVSGAELGKEFCPIYEGRPLELREVVHAGAGHGVRVQEVTHLAVGPFLAVDTTGIDATWRTLGHAVCREDTEDDKDEEDIAEHDDDDNSVSSYKLYKFSAWSNYKRHTIMMATDVT